LKVTDFQEKEVEVEKEEKRKEEILIRYGIIVFFLFLSLFLASLTAVSDK
jgi:hypothetical protein